MPVVTMRQLLDSGVHFGHQTRRWNPKMKRFIFTERNGIYIIDLQQSLSYIDRAYEFVKETVAHGGTILFVGTKKQAQEPIAEQATRVGMPYVNHRWLGGMLTNFQTISKRLTRLKELEEIDFDTVAGSGYTKKELLILRREKEKLEKALGGIDFRVTAVEGLGIARVVAVERPGDAEVHHLHLAGVGEHNIRRLDIAVNDSRLMGCLQGLRDRLEDLRRLLGRQRAIFANNIAQRSPVDPLHHDIRDGHAIQLGFPGVINRHDIGVIQLARVLGLAVKTLPEIDVARHFRAEHLYRNLAA